MTDLFLKAWHGWHEYLGNARIIALLMVMLILMWVSEEWKKEKRLFFYTIGMMIACIFPISAMVLLVYQTRFFDYKWVFSTLPIVLVIAYGATVGYFKIREAEGSKKSHRVALVLAAIAIALLCGSLQKPEWTVVSVDRDRQKVQKVLEETLGDERDICLWAPQDIMEYARDLKPDLRLLYGRNMWDKSLNAYSYDEYSAQQEECFVWMDWVNATGDLDSIKLDGIACVKSAQAMGANRMLLPLHVKEECIQAISEALESQPVVTGEYYVFVLEQQTEVME